MAKEKRNGIKIVAKNRKARFNYEIHERFEAGLVLIGSEVKSIRQGRVSISESYARPRRGEFFVFNMDILPYEFAGPLGHEAKRPRKLLLKKAEIRRLMGKTREKGLTLIPMTLYFKNGRAKLEVALGKGRPKKDKRDVIKKREMERDLRARGSRKR